MSQEMQNMRIFLILTAVAAIASTELQASTTELTSVTILQSDTLPARPIGGLEKFFKTWKTHAYYTKEAKKDKVEGRVHIRFMVNEDGSLSEFEVRKSLGYGLDEVAIEAIKKCGNWNPKRIDGTPVKEEMIVPFTFKR